MTYLKKKLILKFTVILVFSLLLAWKNSRPVSIKNSDEKILGEVCNENFNLAKVIDSKLNLSNSDDYEELKKMLQNKSFDDFSSDSALNQMLIKFDIQSIFKYKKLRDNVRRNKKEFDTIIGLLSKDKLQNKLSSDSRKIHNIRFSFNALFLSLLNESYHNWNDKRDYSLKCLNAARSFLNFMIKNELRLIMENSALLNCLYSLSIMKIVEDKGAEREDILSILECTSSNPFSINQEKFLLISKAKLKYELFKLAQNPQGKIISPEIRKGLRIYSWDMKKTFNEIDELYNVVASTFGNKNWMEKSQALINEDFKPPESGGAFGFLTRDAEDKRELNNWFLSSLSRVMLSEDLNSYQNVLQMGTNLDLLSNSMLKLYLHNKSSKQLEVELLKELNKKNFISVKVINNKLVMEINFKFVANSGIFTKLPKKIRLKIPVEIGI